jgi:hypothetical protein
MDRGVSGAEVNERLGKIDGGENSSKETKQARSFCLESNNI